MTRTKSITTVILITTESYPMTGLDRPSGLQKFYAPRISRQLAYESGKVVYLLYALAAFTSLETSLVLISIRG
jgi:hypothetical protein